MHESKIEKQLAITRCIQSCAEATARLAPVAFTRKRPRICKRMPTRAHAYRRAQARKKALACVQLAINTTMTVIQIGIIQSQPIPKFKPGAK